MRQTMHGVLSMPNLKLRSEANSIQLFLKMSICLNQPWAALFIYWLGFLCKDIYPDLSTNKYVHTIYIPQGMLCFKQLILKYKLHKEIWKSHLKQVYNIILYKSSNKSTEINYSNVNWQIVWKSLQSFSNPLHKTITGISMVLYRWETILWNIRLLINYQTVQCANIESILKNIHLLNVRL